MKEEGIFEQYDFYRETTIELLDSVVSEEQADVIPQFSALELRTYPCSTGGSIALLWDESTRRNFYKNTESFRIWNKSKGMV
ncbi:hypothetical protein [Sutcliffiella rhizosphaerae]|uniref:hypothetical protein n=1 Tax=Sutcliffiella rhizosphaerae TaxID=2880967 RepID=UPI001E29E325|nr:hypothetical protein [Sutcliffiella rhizosphaerae]